MKNLSGTPGVVTEVTPLGTIIANNVKGIICLQGPTERGEPGKNKILATWGDYKQYFGNEMPEDDFALMCKQALEKGSKLRVARAFHYTDIDDISTVVGTAASKALNNSGVSGVGAKIEFNLDTWGGLGDNILLSVTDLVAAGNFDLIDYDGLAAQTKSAAVTAIVAAINAGTGTHQYVATNPIAEKIVITKPVTLGANGNGDISTITLSGTAAISGGLFQFSGGITTVVALTSLIKAKAVGAGYNGTIVTISNSASNKLDEVDIEIQLPGAPNVQTLSGIKKVIDLKKLESLNKTFEGIEISGLVNYTFPLGTAVLENGVQDISLIDDVDFKGSVLSKSGWHSFDEVVDSMRIFNVARPTHQANYDLGEYCKARTDMRARGFIPKGLTISGVADFRNGSGAYLHQPIDNWYLDLYHSEVYISDPENLDNKEYAISGGGLQCANRSIADNSKGEWISDSGNDFGKISGVNGLRLNLGSPGNKGLYDSIYESGVNAIINDSAMKIVNWGNRSTLLDKTSLLSKTNIADMVVFIARELTSIARKMNFKPNDVKMFNQLYRESAPFIRDILVSGRAIEGAGQQNDGEGVWWHWFGDQFATDLNDLKLNKKSEVDAGKYRLRFAFKPIGANEYIAIDIAPTDSTTILNVAILTDLSL